MADLIGQTLGAYRIESQLGAGGMGEVYRGTHTRLNRPAAIKVLHANQAADPTFQARFLREARAAAALSHPNIVEVFDFGEENGASYLVMELVPDGSLRTLLRQRPSGQGWTLGLGIDLVRQAAEGLAYAHEHGMVHRDIKPDNLLLQRLGPPSANGDAERYQLKISDFGLARLVDDAGELTATGMVMGTPTYMSPEQCQGAELDGRSDLYSLGVVLYEVATGTPPFRVKSLSEAVFKHISATPPRPREIQPDLPPALDDIIMRCLEKNPANRIATGTELTMALNGILGPADMQTIVTPYRATGAPGVSGASGSSGGSGGSGAPIPAGSDAGMAPTVADSRADKISFAPPAHNDVASAASSSAGAADTVDNDATIRATVSAGPSPRAGNGGAPAWLPSWASGGNPPNGSLQARLRQPRVLAIGAASLVVILILFLTLGLRPLLASFARSGTPTPHPTATIAPTATPADKVVFQDSMSKSSSRWATGARSYFNDGGFEINGAWLVFSPTDSMSDGTVSVRLRQVGGVNDQFYGLVFRAQNNENYYIFALSESQQWTFQRVSNGGHKFIVPPTTDAHIKGGQNASNTILVRMRGSHFTFFVNGVQVGQADDGAYARGTLGLVNIVSRLQVIYNDFTVAVPA